MASFTLIALSALVVSLFYYIFHRKSKSPPGPWGLPFVGNLLSLDSQLHRSFEKWGKDYGPIVSVKFGGLRAVILDDINVIREALGHSAFAGRPDLKLFNYFAGGKHGVVNSEGPEWVEQRRFTLRNLRDFGFGKTSMETLIMDEVEEVLDWMKQNEGKPVSVNRKFSLAVVNALLTITTGRRYAQDDEVVKHLLDYSSEIFTEASRSGLVWFMPHFTSMFPNFFGWTQIVAAAKAYIKFFEKIVKEHLDNSTGSTDFIHAYLEQIEKTTDSESSFYKDRGNKGLITVLIDLFDAGSSTTTSTLAWLILYVMAHPDVQTKLQEELDNVTGKTRAPCLADRPNTPYAEAIIQETLRFSSIIPFSVFHSTTTDVEFHGYSIPKDTLIVPNLHAVHHCPKTWGDPENFRPERFLGSDGKVIKSVESLIPFSTGKRVCVGEVLARDQIYLFLTNIFYKFRAIPNPEDPMPSFEPNGSFSLQAKPFNVIFKDRLDKLTQTLNCI